MVHHVSVIQSGEARLLDAVAAALPRPGLKCCRVARRAGQTIGAAANDPRRIRRYRLTWINVVDGKQVIMAFDPRRIAFFRGDQNGDRTRAPRDSIIDDRIALFDRMPLSEIA
jgi:hypothetical protein